METDELKSRENDLTCIYSIMSPLELTEEYDAYVTHNDYGVLYDALIREISSRSHDSPTHWVEKVKKYNEFLIQSDKLRLNPKNVFEHIPEKGNLLSKVRNCNTLKGDKRSIKTLITLGDVKLGIAFQSTHSTAQKQLGI